MTIIKAVSPYIYSNNQLNFKFQAYRGWVHQKGPVAKSYYPPRGLRKLVFRYDLIPTFCKGKEARLCFVQPISLYFDTFSSSLFHEIVPFFWDCWPTHYNMVEKWLKKHKVKSAIFTSRMEMEAIKQRIPELNTLWCHEGVDTKTYVAGALLQERQVDVLEFGRANKRLLGDTLVELKKSCNFVCTLKDGKYVYSEKELPNVMAKTKVSICFPRCMTHPESTGGIETLTQRYWEAMLSRIVIAGHAPQELIDVCGYNPVIEIPLDGNCSIHEKIREILDNIEEYQGLVDKNRLTALKYSSWDYRMVYVQKWLCKNGYSL